MDFEGGTEGGTLQKAFESGGNVEDEVGGEEEHGENGGDRIQTPQHHHGQHNSQRKQRP